MPEPATTDTTTHSLSVMRRALFLSSFPIGVLTFAIPIFGRQFLALDAVQITWLFSIYALMTVIVRPVAGWAMDRYGRRRFFVAGLTLQIASNLFLAVGISFDWLFWGRVLQGIAAGMIWLSAYAITADLAARGGRGNMFGAVEEMLSRGGLYGAAVAIPFLVRLSFNPFSLELKIDQFAWSGMFVGYTALNVIALWLAYRRLPETYTPVAASQGNGSVISSQLIILAGIVLVTSTALRGLEPILPIYIQDHFTKNVLLLAVAYLPAALIFGFLQSRLGRIADKVGRKLPIAAGLLISGLSSLLLPSLSELVAIIGLWALLPVVALWMSEAAGFSAATPAEQALVADISGSRRGAAFGVYTFALSMGQVLGPLVGGQLYDRVAPSAPFYTNTIVLWAGALTLMLVLRDPYQRQPGVTTHIPPHEPPPPQWPVSGGP